MARELDISKSLQRNWLARYRLRNGTAVLQAEQAAEVMRLKRQLAEREEAVAILKKAAANRRLDAATQRLFDDHRGCYGAPRITLDLRAKGLRARAARRCKATTPSQHRLPVAPHRLQQDFTVADITYLWTAEGWRWCWICTCEPWWVGPWGNGSPGTCW